KVGIGAHTSVANSILMDDVILGPASVVQDGVIGSGVVDGAGLLAAAGACDVQIEGEWHAVPELGAPIGEDVEIANGVSVAPGTIINERARIESGARLRGAIPSGAVVLYMCGIVGYAGRRNALPILLDGLKRLEYRGYDSAGVAIVGSGLQVVKDKGFIANLEAQLPPLIGSTGFAHTRWATHGAPSKVNAHPHIDCTGKIALAHNGIIENYAALREKLEARGHKFVSQTDTESLVHLIES